MVDECVGRLWQAARAGMAMLVTADHGNCEMMIDPQTGEPHTAHTLNPVAPPPPPPPPPPPRVAAPPGGGAPRRPGGGRGGVAAPAQGGGGAPPRGGGGAGGPAPGARPRRRPPPRRRPRLARPRLPAALRRVRRGRAAEPFCACARRGGRSGPARLRALRAARPRALCGACRADPPFDAVRAGRPLRRPARRRDPRLQVRRPPRASRARSARGSRAAPLPPGALVVSVPLARGRRVERGYDQAALLATRSPAPPARRRRRADARARPRDAAAGGKTRAERRRNVAGAFEPRAAESRARTSRWWTTWSRRGLPPTPPRRALREAGARSRRDRRAREGARRRSGAKTKVPMLPPPAVRLRGMPRPLAAPLALALGRPLPVARAPPGRRPPPGRGSRRGPARRRRRALARDRRDPAGIVALAELGALEREAPELAPIAAAYAGPSRTAPPTPRSARSRGKGSPPSSGRAATSSGAPRTCGGSGS